MRLSSFLTLACAIAAFVLSLLCLFAGSSKSFLQHADLLTLNISRIGHTSVFNTSDGNGGFLDNLVNDIEGDLNSLVSDVTSDIAEALDLPDFFNVHLMDFCEGSYQPNATVRHAHENITDCSNRTTLFHFQPTKVIQEKLPSGVTLDDIHWPQKIQDAEHALKIASIAMIVLYIIGIAFAGIAVLTALWGIWTDGRLSAMVNFLVDMLAFLSLGIASAIATAIIVKAVDSINKYGDDIGIAAYKGSRFLGMTWAATVVMLLASITSIAQCCTGRHKRDRYGEKGTAYQY
ncbi:hypothetical protein A1O1_07405 [Capronia coronata CBS 617.96]|uniref:Uncharacterized protein n=1 Tax=Capronia coronata CBS 617.96 TaxID=1182541 RepID=W9XU65_9EURO|nr:uncharacterized protein A1O1_07405 [Capronia coronata CBS 617.96]EXJ83778.1 hypothetical protein A1O1_07405 [Capronia coronata CBS 617.96]